MAKNREFGSIQLDAEKASFFKFLAYEDLASESMRLIPHKFKSSVCKNLPLKVILKVVWGRSWRVNLSKFKDTYIMERKGWEKFLNDNKLGDREFLTFTNEGNNCLSVTTFQKNCKEILIPRDNTVVASSSSYLNVKEEGPVTAECTSKGVKQKEKRAEEEEAQKKSEKMKMNADNVYRASSSSSSSSDATFSFTITPSSLILATIPQKFAEKHMPKKRTTFTIQDPNGKSWEVVYFYSEAQKLFSSGWRVLAREWGLAVGDICTFKLIKPKEMVLEVLRASQMK